MYKILELLMIILFGFSLPSITYETIKGSNTICIDPGHGGKDGGCERNGIFEKDINLKLAYHLRDELQSMGYIVEMTRLGDYDLASPKAKIRKIEDLNKRCEVINKNKLFISIHVNHFDMQSVSGAQVFCINNKQNILLAELIQQNLNLVTKKNKDYKICNDKYLLNNAKSIGCLVEVGFISNDNEFEKLNNEEYQLEIAKIISISILQYLEKINS